MAGGSLVESAKLLGDEVKKLTFAPPVAYVYNPLDYAWPCHERYLRLYASGRKRVFFLGMNPGPFGMAQTGVPFGEIAAVRDWLRIRREVGRPNHQHPKRIVTGFDCKRSEVSGRRLWSLFAKRFGNAKEFFRNHLVINYCPLAFLEDSGKNRTPDKLPASEREVLFALCDNHLRAFTKSLQPKWVIGIGDFAAKRAQVALNSDSPRIGRILHPSPANPAANRDWEGRVTAELIGIGVWQ